MGRLLLFLHLLLFHFLSFSSSSSSSHHSLCHPDQSSALLQFKTTFDNYYDEAGRKTATWINGTDCCSWLGITCDTLSGHVIGLNLSNEWLEGIINPNSTLFHLSHLQTLNLAFNYFSLSSQFGGFATLTHLNLSGSQFAGEVPSQISHLSTLVSLDLSENYELMWKETTWRRLMQNVTNLRELVLDYTNLSSIRPSSMSLLHNLSSSLVTLSLRSTQLRGDLTNDNLCLPNLQHLYLSDNFLQGPLPKLSCSTFLSILDLSGCQFQGLIPPSFSNLTHLTYLSLSDSQFNESIPSSLLTLPNLTFLYLRNNSLNGQIPDVFPQSNRFQEIDLSHNNIRGELPPSLSNLQHLIHLDISNNRISGLIPSSLSHLQHLTYLDLSSNKLSGQITNVFSGLTKLETLDLSGNNFGGQIPSSLFHLTQLSFLELSSNKLEGYLPNKITGVSSLTSLLVGNNLLNGTIPSWCLSLPSLVELGLSNNQFTGHIGAISSYSLVYLNLCSNKLQGNIPRSIFNLVSLTSLCLSSNNLSGPINLALFSKLHLLNTLYLSQNSQLSLNFGPKVSGCCSHLKALDLSSMGLTEFPELSEIFPKLVYIDLSNNKLSGRVPDNWFNKYVFLNFSQNLLSSSLNQFSRDNVIRFLDLSFNLLVGEIPSSICQVSSLRILNLAHNKLSGIIPQCLGNLSSLRALDLQMNHLYGTLPSTFSRNNSLRSLNLNGNQLQGLLSEALSNCRKLELLNLGNNQIEDIFPHWLQALPNLKVLILRANKFYGPIGDSKTKHPFRSLIIFDISCNNFSGSIPIAYFKAMNNFVQAEMDGSLQYMEVKFFVGGIITDNGSNRLFSESVTVITKGINIAFMKIPTIFVSIDLSKNKFEGEIPYIIGELHALKGLNLSHNGLVGPMPQSMGNLTNLESLDLSSNMLTGKIPTELTNLNYLEVLNLSHNRLVGEIPRGEQFDTFLNDSYEGNLGLCGLPLSMKCNNDHLEQHYPPTSSSEEKFGFGWKPVAIGYGCGMVFGVGLGCLVLFIGKPQWLVRMVGGQPNRRVKKRARMRKTRGTISQLVQLS